VAKSRFSFLAKFLAGVTLNEADKGDRTTEPEVSSVLSVRSEGVSRVQEIEETLIKDKNPQKMLRIEADITDKTISSCRECPHYLLKAVNPNYPAWCMFWQDVLLEENPACLAYREGKTPEEPSRAKTEAG
jgi:hypothetical protein